MEGRVTALVSMWWASTQETSSWTDLLPIAPSIRKDRSLYHKLVLLRSDKISRLLPRPRSRHHEAKSKRWPKRKRRRLPTPPASTSLPVNAPAATWPLPETLIKRCATLHLKALSEDQRRSKTDRRRRFLSHSISHSTIQWPCKTWMLFYSNSSRHEHWPLQRTVSRQLTCIQAAKETSLLTWLRLIKLKCQPRPPRKQWSRQLQDMEIKTICQAKRWQTGPAWKASNQRQQHQRPCNSWKQMRARRIHRRHSLRRKIRLQKPLIVARGLLYSKKCFLLDATKMLQRDVAPLASAPLWIVNPASEKLANVNSSLTMRQQKKCLGFSQEWL